MRKSTPDLLKGIAVMMMVQVHLAELFATESFTAGFWGKMSLFYGGPPAAPVFMIVMGYFAMLSDRDFGTLILRGVKLILLGLILNIMLNAHALIRIFFGTLELDPLKFIFGADILPLAGLSIIIIALLRLTFGKNPLPFLVLLIITLIMPFFNPLFLTEGRASYGMAFIAGNYSWSYFPLFPWLAYPLSGCLLSVFERAPRVKTLFEKHWIWILVISLSLVLTTAWFAVPQIVSLPLYYHHNVLLFLWIILFIFIWYSLFHKLNSGSPRAWPLVYLQWVGKNVTAFYVFQWIIIGNLATWLYHTQRSWHLILWFVSITGVVSLLVLGWNRYRQFRKKDVIL